MSRSNIPGCENKSIDNYGKPEKALNLPDINDLRKLSNMPEFINRGRNIINNEFIVDNHILQSHVPYDLSDDNSDIKKTCLNIESKKLMNKSYEDEKPKLISNINDQHEEMNYETRSCLPDLIDNNDNESIPLVNIFKYTKTKNVMNSSQNLSEPYRESFPPNKMPLRMFVGDVQEIPNIPSIPTTFNNFNGYHINRVKNVSSYGSSFMNNVYPQSLFSLQNPQSLENHDFRNQTKPIKSQNVYFSQQVGDFMEPTPEVDIKKMHLKKENNIKLLDGSNIPFVNNSKILIPCPIGRKEAILIQQPECYETDFYPNMGEMCIENLANHSSAESNEVPPNVLRENYIPVDYIYPNNCYAPQFPILDNRKNVSHINQQIPFQLIPVQGSVLLNSNVNPNFRNMNAYSHYCLTPIPSSYVAYPSDKAKLNMKPASIGNPPDPIIQKHKSTDESYTFYTPDHGNFPQKHQQFSSNNELNRGDNFSFITSNESVIPNVSLAEPTFYLNVSQQNTTINESIKTLDPLINCVTSSSNSIVPNENNTSRPVQKIGKFIVTPVSTNEQPKSIAKSTENILTDNQNIHNYVADDIPKQDRPQQNSRFKKTRIRETVERWCMDGLNTYDCRFKIIPSKIMNLYNSKQEYLSKEIDINESCRRCEAHDKEKYCYDADYHKKEFKFWHNGNHLDLLCGELEENSENYCQFHAKILKLLNQNQNLSLSKYSNNLFDFSENTNLASPQIFQTVLISSPEHDNYIINIDTQASHVLLSAPPVSPSVMNTASISSLPTNIQSPRSATTMVMLKCATPVLLSNATRNATLLNESISIEKINHKASSNMGIDSTDNNSMCGPQIVANENAPLIDLWQSSPIKSDQLAFKLSSPTYVAGTVIADNTHIQGDLCNHQHSVYSIGHMSPLYYPLYQQPRSSISSTLITNKCQDQNSLLMNKDLSGSSDNLPAEIIEEINRSTNSFKSVITNLFQVEHSKLLSEISVLRKSNEQLANELLKMKTRSDNLEKLLKAKHDLSDDPQENSLNLNHSEFHQTEFDYNNLI